jgi:hypothetical protein
MSDILNSNEIEINNVEMQNRVNNFDHVQSTVIKRDEKGNVTDQWV